jgi:hypothetical protein
MLPQTTTSTNKEPQTPETASGATQTGGKPLPIEVRTANLLTRFSAFSVELGKKLEKEYGLLMDDARHSSLVQMIEDHVQQFAAAEKPVINGDVQQIVSEAKTDIEKVETDTMAAISAATAPEPAAKKK